MKVSIYKNIKSTTPEVNRDVFKVLDSIKNGEYKSLLGKIRIEPEKEIRNKLKEGLPLATFCGTFSSRANNNLKKHSGLSCLDFDNVEDIGKLRFQLNNDKYTFCHFLSPGGKGIKLLVKIPLVSTNEDYHDYYHELQNHFDQYSKTDDATKAIANACYLSFDDELFLNTDSELFANKFNRPIKSITEVTNIPIIDQDEIANRLEVWFRKRFKGSNRNSNLHALARQFNAFGVTQSICEQYLLRYEEADFKQREILTLITSAYKYTSEYGTQSFEDSKKVNDIKNLVLSGQSESAIKTKITDVEDEKLDDEIQKHKSEVNDDEFWYYTDKNVMKLGTFRFLKYLEKNSISKYFPSDNTNSYLFIKKDNNFIKEFGENRIKDFTLSDLRNRGLVNAFELCADSLMTFSQNYLSMLKTSEIEIQRDEKDCGYIYYQNTAVKITKDGFDIIGYNDLNGLVWENQVIDRDLDLSDESDGEFRAFIWKISGENADRYYTFKSVIGYLLHSFQNEGKPKVIIFNDEMIADIPNGGSGKGLIHKSIGHIKKLSTINGKGFDTNKQFAYQTIGQDTQVLLFDDIDKNFKFETLFSLITEGLVIEKKGKDAIKIPFNESPKISITTNYTVKGEGSSHLRRVFEVEMSSYFNDTHTPEDEFGHLLFTDWSDSEWAKFDNYMLRCMQYYLKNGLVESKTVNLELRKLRNETSNDFLDFMDNLDFNGDRYFKSDLKDRFVDEYDDFKYAKWFSSTVFNKWVVKYCDYKDLTLEKGKSNGQRWLSIEEKIY